MHMITAILAILAILALSSLASAHAIDNTFLVWTGTEGGGCDDYNTDSLRANLRGYFLEAQKIVSAAHEAFQDYGNREVQKVAWSFFGIIPRPDGVGPVHEHEAAFNAVLTGFDSLRRWFNQQSGQPLAPPGIANTAPGRIPLRCNTDWMEITDIAYDINGQEIPGETVITGPGRGYAKIENGDYVAYWAEDIKAYHFGPPYHSDPPDFCSEQGNLAAVFDMRPVPNPVDETVRFTLALCHEMFVTPRANELLDDIPMAGLQGTFLDLLQPRCLTLIHEVAHLAIGFANSPDLLAVTPDLPTHLPNGQFNPEWPGDQRQFTEKKYQTATAIDAMLTAQALPRRATEKNPESFAWAAIAIYLAKTKSMDYSSGRSWPIGGGFRTVVPGPPGALRPRNFTA